MATCWEPRASFRVHRELHVILAMEWNIPDTDATKLLTVWTDQVEDYEQQHSNTTFGGFRSGCNPRTHDECDLMAADKGKAQEPKTMTTRGKESATRATGVLILRRTA